jgi:primosomal protein N' (replication factor Y) (superfamily II helicase)
MAWRPLPGGRVAPLGPRQIIGVVWDEGRLPAPRLPKAKLRPLLEVLPVAAATGRSAPPDRMDGRLLLRAAVIGRAHGAGRRRCPARRGTTTEYRLSGPPRRRLTPQRAKALEALGGRQATIRELAAIAGVSEAVLRGMAGAGCSKP